MPETHEQNHVAEVLTLPEAASFLRVSEEALTELAEGHALPARRIADEWRFSRRALEDWLRFPGSEDSWRIHPRWLLEGPFMEEFLLYLEKRLLMHLRQTQPEERHPKPGSKQAVLRHFGVFRDDPSLRQMVDDIYARRKSEEGKE